jgi:hypothetical protein
VKYLLMIAGAQTSRGPPRRPERRMAQRGQ